MKCTHYWTVTSECPKCLRAELDNAQHHIEMLQAKLDAEKSCACAYDDPNEVCLPHSPLLEKAADEIEKLRAENERLRAENKEKQAAFHATHVERDDLRSTIKRMREQLKDPNVVALNMLHGKIALPSVEQIKHIYQDRFLPLDEATVVSERDEALEGKS